MSRHVIESDVSGSVVGTTGTQTLTNKTLTTPAIDVINEATAAAGVTADGVLLKDGTVRVSGANGNLTLSADTDGGQFNIGSSATGTLAFYGAAGNTLNVDILDGTLSVGGVLVPTISSTSTLTNKTLTSPVINTPTGIVKGDVGLGNVDNTSDATKNGATATLTNKRITNRVESMTDGATITPTGDSYDHHKVTLGGNRTMAAPSGTPVDGDMKMFVLKQDATGSRTITWNAIYRFSGGTAPTLTTTAAKTDYIGFRYNSGDTKWDCVAERLNF